MPTTRARAKALGISTELPPSKQGFQKRVSKREAAEDSDAHIRPKRRTVLKDVTNITCEKLYMNLKNGARKQVKTTFFSLSCLNSIILDCCRRGKSHPAFDPPKLLRFQNFEKTRIPKRFALQSTQQHRNLNPSTYIIYRQLSSLQRHILKELPSSVNHLTYPLPDYSSELKLWTKPERLEDSGIIDVDTKSNDPQMCGIYAADIYDNLYAKEVDHRPCIDYMEKKQRDITKGMRAVLIDWLVEVSEEYRLVPDTLYLTVNLIDRYLSENSMEKQRLQLLGVTCMLIASKYEEMRAPSVEELCFITDSTYTKEEVVKMESRVLNFLRFQLSVPTTKKFLRRFIQAAQLCYEVASVELELLANYLAELTLIDYTFLKFLPSLIAASAVFLARWTLDHTHYPWNSTLEHYTRYNSAELQTTVVELQNLQLDTSGTINAAVAIREKYKQPKFRGVSTLRSPHSIRSLF
ncbi:hypothetical protein M569_11441, partial [Genlisea aurea]